MVFHGYRSRLVKIWSCKTYVYTGPQYLYQNIKVTHGDGIPWGGPRLFKVWIHGKYDYAGRQHLHTKHKNDIWKWYSIGTNQDYSKTGFAENTNTLGLSICTQNMRITYENDFPWGQIKITQILDSQKITFTLGVNICTQIKRLRIKFVCSVGTI